MTRSEAAVLLGLAAARDRRIVGDADVLAWAEDLDDITFDEAHAALREHFRESTEYFTAAHVRTIVKRHRALRRRGSSAPMALPSRFETPAEQRELNAHHVAAIRDALARKRQSREDTPA